MGVVALVLWATPALRAAQLTVAWNDNSTAELGFQVERSTNGSTFTTVATVGANVTSYADTSVASATQYWYRVKAFDLVSSSAYSNVTSVTTAATSSTTTTAVTDPALSNTPSAATIAAISTSVPVIQGRIQALTVRAVGGSTVGQLVSFGFTVSGGDKSVLLRAVGPGLSAFATTARMADPRFSLSAGTTLVTANDNWGGSDLLATTASRVGALPLVSSSLDAAVDVKLRAGDYSQSVQGLGTGLVQAEVYESDTAASPAGRFSKMRVRANVGIGAEVLTAGLVITGNTHVRLLLRAVGPSLGLSTGLADPTLSLYKGASLIANNDNSGGSAALATACSTVGAAALSASDAALVVTLAPGVYGLTVAGVSSGTGVGQLEIYEYNPPSTVIRINAGGASYTGATGVVWGADSGFNTGNTYTTGVVVTGTADPTLYKTERYHGFPVPALAYTFAVPNGTYIVRLHFAETYEPTQGNGKRVFDVDLQSVRAFENVDIFALAQGSARALVLQKTTTVTAGQLRIGFIHQVENPKIDAIEIISTP